MPKHMIMRIAGSAYLDVRCTAAIGGISGGNKDIVEPT